MGRIQRNPATWFKRHYIFSSKRVKSNIHYSNVFLKNSLYDASLTMIKIRWNRLQKTQCNIVSLILTHLLNTNTEQIYRLITQLCSLSMLILLNTEQ